MDTISHTRFKNSKSIIKGHQAYIDSDRGEHMRFTVIDGNVALYKMISASMRHKHRIQKNANSTTTLSTEPALICKMHLIDWKSNMMFTSYGQTFLVVRDEAFVTDQVQIVGTKDTTGSLVKIAEASETRTIKLGKTWDEFLANASKALGYQVKSGHVMKKYSEFGHRSRSMGKRYCVSGWLSSRTFGIQKNHINEMDIVLCHPHTVTEHVLQEAKSRARANRNQKV